MARTGRGPLRNGYGQSSLHLNNRALEKDSLLEILSVAVLMRIRSDGANLVREMPAVSLLMVRVQPPLKSSVLRGSLGQRVRA